MTTATLESQPEGQHTTVSEKIIHWLIFGVIMTLVPFLAAFFDDIDRGVKLSSGALFGRGELLIVAAVVAAGGIGELFGTEVRATRKGPKLIVLGCCVVTVVATSLWFADISSLIISKHPPQPGTVAVGSIILFIFTVIAGFSALLLSEG